MDEFALYNFHHPVAANMEEQEEEKSGSADLEKMLAEDLRKTKNRKKQQKKLQKKKSDKLRYQAIIDPKASALKLISEQRIETELESRFTDKSYQKLFYSLEAPEGSAFNDPDSF
jgi:hypothetical protein